GVGVEPRTPQIQIRMDTVFHAAGRSLASRAPEVLPNFPQAPETASSRAADRPRLDSRAMAIVPDSKDWTWVLERRCPECGFVSAELPRDQIAPMIRT